MPTTPHPERHFTANETVRNIVIGTSDGLTVPFALAAEKEEIVEILETYAVARAIG